MKFDAVYLGRPQNYASTSSVRLAHVDLKNYIRVVHKHTKLTANGDLKTFYY
jgi:hypothetical protein